MSIKLIAQNRKARYDYHIIETWEAGLVLQGTEVKSLRLGKANLRDAYAKISNGEVYLHNCHISPYEKEARFNHDPLRVRKLLLNKREIRKLSGKVEEKGFTLIALKMYFLNGRAKIEIGLARGKRNYDRRQDITRRDTQREMERALKRKL